MELRSPPRPVAHRGLLPFVAACLLWACDSTPTEPEGRYLAPPETGDGWATAEAGAVGMDVHRLAELLTLVDTTPHHRIHSLLVVRHGRLVLEEYWPGWDLATGGLDTIYRSFDRETPHYVASVSKSITSMLTGIALAEGHIGSVDDSLFSFFPDYAELASPEKEAVTLRSLLSFSSGLDWNEFDYGFDDPRDAHYQMFRAEDPIRYLLERDMISEPGAEFLYNSGDTNLVGEIVRRTTGSESLLDYLDARLFGPLGITDYVWTVFGAAPHVVFASGGASLRPRDMAKLGQLYLDRGMWAGEQVVPSDWVDASVGLSIPFTFEHRTLYGYGFNWWLGRSRLGGGTVDFFRAVGWGGQTIFVYPHLDLVVVLTRGGFYESLPLNVNDLIEDYIFAALGG